ncbi:MAG: siderophore biosynthesis protein, partial [Bacteroides sp.]|nr:siderophore biosynthesis protein [Bacteroides sp.]
MALFMQHTEPRCKWGIWKMDESPDELLAMLPQQESYRHALQRFSAEHRRREWLAVRVLLYALLGE